jgi:hypothetical protein
MRNSAEELDEDLDVTRTLLPDESGGIALTRDDDVLTPGAELGAYVIDHLLGAGGGGVVYAAHHRERNLRVAVKILRPEIAMLPTMVVRFSREAEALSKIQHPNVVRIYEVGELLSGQPYYVMELLEGMDLRRFVQCFGRLSPREALDLLAPVLDAVQAVHEAHFLHRDIKASNVMIVESPGARATKLLDFGIAKLMRDDSSKQGLTEPGTMLGTVHNMAPEQIRCERVDERTDIYALGVLIYQVLTGQYPFDASDPHHVALKHLQTPAPRPSALAAVAPAVDSVVLRCLEKQPERRFASVAELATAFRTAVGEEPADFANASATAVGIYVEVVCDAAELDDAVLDDLSVLCDIAEQELAGRDFAFPLRTSTAMLGVRVVGPEEDAAEEQGKAEALAEELSTMLAERPNAQPLSRVRVSVQLEMGQVLCRFSSAGVEVVGGPLLDVSSWVVRRR